MFSWSNLNLYIYVILTIFISYLSYTLYQKEQDLSDYREQVIQLEANNSILKGNLDSLHSTLESTQLQYENYRKLHSVADSEVVELRDENRKLDKKNTEFNQEIINIKKELTIVEAKLLEYKIPDAIVDAYNANSMYNTEVATP